MPDPVHYHCPAYATSTNVPTVNHMYKDQAYINQFYAGFNLDGPFVEFGYPGFFGGASGPYGPFIGGNPFFLGNPFLGTGFFW